MRSSPRAASGAQAGDRAAVRGAVAVRRGEVEVGERRQRVLGALERLRGAPRRRVERALGSLRDELVARAEVLVEAAVGQPGRLHDLGDAGRRPCPTRASAPRRSRRCARGCAFFSSCECPIGLDDTRHPDTVDDGHHPVHRKEARHADRRFRRTRHRRQPRHRPGHRRGAARARRGEGLRRGARPRDGHRPAPGAGRASTSPTRRGVAAVAAELDDVADRRQQRRHRPRRRPRSPPTSTTRAPSWRRTTSASSRRPRRSLPCSRRTAAARS